MHREVLLKLRQETETQRAERIDAVRRQVERHTYPLSERRLEVVVHRLAEDLGVGGVPFGMPVRS